MTTAPTLHAIGEVVSTLREEFPDVSHSSLRFLEREGLLKPHRTSGGHRLYTDDDLERIRQIKRWQQQRLSLDEIRQRLAALEADPLAELVTRLANELVRRKPTALPGILAADDLGVPLTTLFQDVLLPVESEVGRRWQTGDLRIGQEHEITETVREAIAQLTWRHAGEPHGPVILAACAPGEQHDLGLRMVVGLLRARGRRVQFLGCNVDAAILLEEIRERRPAMVLLSATSPARLPALQDLLQTLQQNPGTRGIPMVVGGAMVPALKDDLRRIGAIPNLETDLSRAVESIVRLSEQQALVNTGDERTMIS